MGGWRLKPRPDRRLKSRLRDLTAFGHKVRLRGLPDDAPSHTRWRDVCETRAGQPREPRHEARSVQGHAERPGGRVSWPQARSAVSTATLLLAGICGNRSAVADVLQLTLGGVAGHAI